MTPLCWLPPPRRAVADRDGDARAEGKARRRLSPLLAKKMACNAVWSLGTRFISTEESRKVFSGNDIKLSKRDRNIAGLQLADLIALPRQS